MGIEERLILRMGRVLTALQKPSESADLKIDGPKIA